MSNPQNGNPDAYFKMAFGETSSPQDKHMRHSIAFNAEKLIASYCFQRADISLEKQIRDVFIFANYRRPFVPNLSPLSAPCPSLGRRWSSAFNRGLYNRATRNLNWGHFAPRRSS